MSSNRPNRHPSDLQNNPKCRRRIDFGPAPYSSSSDSEDPSVSGPEIGVLHAPVVADTLAHPDSHSGGRSPNLRRNCPNSGRRVQLQRNGLGGASNSEDSSIIRPEIGVLQAPVVALQEPVLHDPPTTACCNDGIPDGATTATITVQLMGFRDGNHYGSTDGVSRRFN